MPDEGPVRSGRAWFGQARPGLAWRGTVKLLANGGWYD
jgi:hypothetical protein